MAFRTVRLFWAGAYPLDEFSRTHLGVEKKGIVYRVFSATSRRRQGQAAYFNPEVIYVGRCTKARDYLACLRKHRSSGDFAKWRSKSKRSLFYSVGLVEDVWRRKFSRGFVNNLTECLIYRLRPQFNQRIAFYKGKGLEIISEGDCGGLPNPILCAPLRVPPITRLKPT